MPSPDPSGTRTPPLARSLSATTSWYSERVQPLVVAHPRIVLSQRFAQRAVGHCCLFGPHRPTASRQAIAPALTSR
jgi:hypothetical protein